MNITPTLDLNHQEFHFGDNTEIDYKCCGFCWKSKPKQKQYVVDESYKIKEQKNPDYRTRILANNRLATILSHEIHHDPIAMDRLFELLKTRINYDITNGTELTSEKLALIINALHEVKFERSCYTPRNTRKALPNMRNGKKTKRIPRDSESRVKLP